MPDNTDTGEMRYDRELGPGYFTLTPNDFLANNDTLSATAKLLYIVLLMHCGRGAEAWPGTERLCRLCSVKSRTTLRAAIGELAAVGLVEVIRRGLTLPNLYIVHKYELVPPKRERPDGQNLALSRNNADGQNMAVKLANRRHSRRSTTDPKLEVVELDPINEMDNASHSAAQPDYASMTLEEREAVLAKYQQVNRYRRV